MDTNHGLDRSRLWTAVVVLIAAPVLLTLCSILWNTPYPLSEGVGLLEDVVDPVAFRMRFFDPGVTYYRPLFHLSLFTAWHASPSLDVFVSSVRLFHIVPVIVLVVLLIALMRPARATDAAAATLALAVLFGSPGFKDNLEIPLTYTIVGMVIALAVWRLLERAARPWHGLAIVALTLIAIGFKEQGLVMVPVIVLAWWMGAPGVGRGTALAVVAIAAAYVALRLGQGDGFATFAQDIGFGFTQLPARVATERFGSSPLWMYAYNGASTIANVLFAEPTAGVFSVTRAVLDGEAAPWHVVYLASSILTTVLMAWWAIGAVRRSMRVGWTAEARLAGALVVALAASGALSFNYSRDRLGGMAVVFYVLASFYAVRAFVDRLEHARVRMTAVAGLVLLLLAGAWQVRTIHTLEGLRRWSANSQREWITDLQERRTEFARRPVFIGLMEDLRPQGTAPGLAQQTLYPEWVLRILGPF